MSEISLRVVVPVTAPAVSAASGGERRAVVRALADWLVADLLRHPAPM